MKTPEQFRTAMQGLCDQAWALASLATVVESGVIESLGEPRSAAELAARHGMAPALVTRLLDVLAAVGMVVKDGDRYRAETGLGPFLAGPGRDIVRADLRSTLLQSGHMVNQSKQGRYQLEWAFTDPEILNAQGLLSLGAMDPVQNRLFPMMDGLLDRLHAPGGAILDIGAGIGALCVGFARAYPQVRVVGLEPAPAPLAEAEKYVAASGVAARIELRAQTIQELPDQAAFDFVWLPQMFLNDAVLAESLPVCLRALRPRGWFLTISVAPPGDDVPATAARLRNTLWGGEVRSSEDLAAQVGAAGFERVQVVPAPGWVRPVIARRAPTA